MPADDALDQTLLPEVIAAAISPIPLPGRVHHGQVSRMTLGQEALLEGRPEALRMAGADESADRDGRAVRHQARPLLAA